MKQVIAANKKFTKELPTISWDNIDYFHQYFHPFNKEKSTHFKFNNVPTKYFEYGLSCSYLKAQKIVEKVSKDFPRKISTPNFIIFNEIIKFDRFNLIPRWYKECSEKVPKYIDSFRKLNPGVTTWLSNHKLLSPLNDRDGKKEFLIKIAKQSGIDGIGIQVYWDWRYEAISGDITEYLKRYAEDVRNAGLEFTISEWSVFNKNPEKQWYQAEKLLKTFSEIDPVWNCYWYFSDYEFQERPQPGKALDSNPGLFDADLNPKPIAKLFDIHS